MSGRLNTTRNTKRTTSIGAVFFLCKEWVTVVDGIENYEYGKFVHILDDEDNRVELWEANDEGIKNAECRCQMTGGKIN